MIKIKNKEAIKLMRVAGQINYHTHQLLSTMIKPGITTRDLDQAAEAYIISQGAIPSFKNYQGFPASICASVNDQVVHGIPGEYQLKSGDLLKIDIGVNYQGYHSDSAVTHIIGEVHPDVAVLVRETQNALYQGILQVKPGKTIGDIAFAIESHAKKYKLGVIKELVGHGVGQDLHEEPNIPNYGKPKSGVVLKPGMTLAIEPMFNLGSPDIVMSTDGWTIQTMDNQPSAHFEHTVLVTDNGYEILTGE